MHEKCDELGDLHREDPTRCGRVIKKAEADVSTRNGGMTRFFDDFERQNKEPPGKYQKYVGKFIKLTYPPSNVSGVVLTEYLEIIRTEIKDGYWFFLMCEMMPRRDKKKIRTIRASQIVRALEDIQPLYDYVYKGDMQIRFTSMDEIRQERREKIVRSIMEA